MTDPFPASACFDGDWLTAVGGVGIDALARDFGTPLYVVDRGELIARMREYRRAFGPDVAVAYAAKALCVTGVLQLVADEGLYVDVASSGELHTAQRAGFPMSRVLLHGNNKSLEELRAAARLRVGRVVVDSFTELRRLSVISTDHGHTFDVLVRVTPGVEAYTHEFVRTGHDDTKFGFTLSSGMAGEAVEAALTTGGVRLRGLHCHIGSQILETKPFAAAVDTMCGLLARLRDEHHLRDIELNLGGGLGVGYSASEPAPSIAEYAGTVLDALDGALGRYGLDRPALAVEPGRSIVGPAGLTLYRVGTIKRVPNVRTYVGVDGGLSDNLRPALYGARHTFAAAGEPATASGRWLEAGANAPDPREMTVVGKHCESGDVLGDGVALPADLAEGDLLAMATTGAYGYAMASNYNRLPRPAMVLVADGRTDLLVRRETLHDLIRNDQRLP